MGAHIVLVFAFTIFNICGRVQAQNACSSPSGFLPSSASCSSYLYCDFLGREQEAECGDGQLWNKDLDSCDLEPNVDCGKGLGGFLRKGSAFLKIGLGLASVAQGVATNLIDSNDFYYSTIETDSTDSTDESKVGPVALPKIAKNLSGRNQDAGIIPSLNKELDTNGPSGFISFLQVGLGLASLAQRVATNLIGSTEETVTSPEEESADEEQFLQNRFGISQPENALQRKTPKVKTNITNPVIKALQEYEEGSGTSDSMNEGEVEPVAIPKTLKQQTRPKMVMSRGNQDAGNIASLNKELDILSGKIQEAGNIASLNKELGELSEKVKEVGNIASLNTELDKFSRKIQVAGNISSLNNELDKLSGKIEGTGNIVSLNKELDKLSGKLQETRNIALLNKELEILSRNIQEARNIASLNKEVEKLVEMIKEAGNIVSLNMELETLSGKIQKTGNIESLNRELNKLTGNIQKAGNIASLNKELDKLSVKIQETGYIASLNKELDKLTENIQKAGNIAWLNKKHEEKTTVISAAPKLLSLPRKGNPSEVIYTQSSITQENPITYKPLLYSLNSISQERPNTFKPLLHSINSISEEAPSNYKPLAPGAPLPWSFPEWVPSSIRVPASTRLLQRSVSAQTPTKIGHTKDFFRQFDSVFANLTK